MNAPLKDSHPRGFSLLELLIVVAMISVISGFAVLNYVQAGRAVSRTNAAVELANHLQKARNDSMRRRPKDVDQMSQVKVFNRRFYSVAVDADGDGYLDIPLVMSFPEEQGVEITGPFPKTFIFDWLGQTVDSQNQRVLAQPVTISNSSGASAITFSETGKVIVVPAVKVAAAK